MTSGAAGIEAVSCRGHCANHADQLDSFLRCEWRHLLPGVPGFHSLHCQHVWPGSPGGFSHSALMCCLVHRLRGLLVLVFG